MSSDLQSSLAELRLNDYMSLVIMIAVGYDYCLTFSREVTYIWKRPWTKVSTLFLLIRYVGCLSAFTFALVGSSFIPGPGPVKVRSIIRAWPIVYPNTTIVDVRCHIINILSAWTRAVFWAGADILMILRVYAIYNRSRTIFGVLLVMYIAEVVVLLIASSIYSSPKYVAVSTVQLFDTKICGVVLSTETWNIVPTIAQFILGTVLCILVIAQFLKQSLQLNRAVGKWSLNRYMNLLTRDGALYFFITLLNGLLNMLGNLNIVPQGRVSLVLIPLADIPVYTLTPRFIINIRELYMLDMEGRQNQDIMIDSGFGLSSRSGYSAGGLTTTETVVFADGAEVERLDDGLEMVRR